MPLVKLSAAVEYFLLNHDEMGRERPEADGRLLSEMALGLLDDPSTGITDVFLMSHGWQGDLPAARRQYDAWLGAVASDEDGLDAARRRAPNFRPLVIGLHWPSLPWGNEELGAPGVLGASAVAPAANDVETWARRTADTPAARTAIATILRLSETEGGISDELRAAYATLAREMALPTSDETGRPGADHPPFDPDQTLAQATADRPAGAAPGGFLLGASGGGLRDLLLAPLRQLSFWKMKDRARVFGETGAHDLLLRIQNRSLRRLPRVHLMGHSFGCIVVTAAVAGASTDIRARLPVNALFLVQGALSLWAFAADIPHAAGTAGYFARVLRDSLVQGPIVATTSEHDRAVSLFYPLGARARGQVVLGTRELPEYGGLGTFGICGVPAVRDMPMLPVYGQYGFDERAVVNLDASSVIRTGGGAAGAHNDIVHPEIAHAFWEAVVAGMPEAARVSDTPSEGNTGSPLPPAALGEPPGTSMSRVDWQSFQNLDLVLPQRALSKILAPGQFTLSPDTAPVWGGILGGSPAIAQPFEAPVPASLNPTQGGGVAPAGTAADGGQAVRYVNVALDDHSSSVPLKVERWYTLMINVDTAAWMDNLASVPLADLNLFRSGETQVPVTVQLDSTDFAVSPATQVLTLRPTGPSLGVLRFGISPRGEGSCRLTITLHRDGNFIQRVELDFSVGAGASPQPEVRAVGRPLSAAPVVRPRDIGLSLDPRGDGYDCVVWGAVAAKAVLPIDKTYLAATLDAFRAELLKVVTMRDAAGRYVFQAAIDIPEDAKATALKILAPAGADLFRKLFFAPGAAQDANNIGEFLLRSLGEAETARTLQVLTLGVPIPWACLYLGDAGDDALLDWSNFLGMRHIVEQIPLQPGLLVADGDMASDKPKLSVSLNLNTNIDAQFQTDVIRSQRAYWTKVAEQRNIMLTERTTRDEVLKSLRDPATTDQLLYFYCHAETVPLNAPGGPDASNITLTDKPLTLRDLNLNAPSNRQRFASAPLVFINACESAELSPIFYDGFVPYFMAKGARGVVGTECNTPALFARAWAQTFFEKFLDGEPVGAAFLALRQQFLAEHGNPLGLLYAVHCDGDTRVSPPA